MTIGDSGEQEERAEDPRTRVEAHLTDFFGRGEAFARQLIAENERLRRELAGESDGEGDGEGEPVRPASVIEELLARVDALEHELAGARAAAASEATTPAEVDAAATTSEDGEAKADEAATTASAVEVELRARVAALEAEKETQAAELSAAHAAVAAAQAHADAAAAAEPRIDPAAHADLVARAEALEADKRALEEAFARANAEAEEAKIAAALAATPVVDPASITELEERCVTLAHDKRALEESSGRLEAENYHLATLTIAIQQLHAGRTLADVLQTITEVCLNFIGIGCFSVLMIDEPRQVAFPVLREGAHIEELEERSLADESPLAAIVGLGRPWQGGDPIPHEYGVLMFLPLTSRARLMGILCLESFLPQKSELSDDDYAVLAMLSEHAGLALENAWCRAHAPPTPLAAAAVQALVSA